MFEMKMLSQVRELGAGRRLCLVHTEAGGEPMLAVARENVLDRLLSLIASCRLFRGLAVVKSHLERVRREDSEALKAFVDALCSFYGGRVAAVLEPKLSRLGDRPLTTLLMQQLSELAFAELKAGGAAALVHFCHLRQQAEAHLDASHATQERDLIELLPETEIPRYFELDEDVLERGSHPAALASAPLWIFAPETRSRNALSAAMHA